MLEDCTVEKTAVYGIAAGRPRGVQPVTLLLADDSEVMRGAIRQLLASDPGIKIVGEATNFVDLLAMASSLKPKVVVIDIHMPGKNNLQCGSIKSQLGGCAILAMSVWNDDATRAIADTFGAVKLLGKSELTTELIPAILQFS